MLNYVVPLHQIYTHVWVVPRPPEDIVVVIDALEALKGIKLSRCLHPVVADPKTDAARTVWAFDARQEVRDLLQEVLGLDPNPHCRPWGKL